MARPRLMYTSGGACQIGASAQNWRKYFLTISEEKVFSEYENVLFRIADEPFFGFWNKQCGLQIWIGSSRKTQDAFFPYLSDVVCYASPLRSQIMTKLLMVMVMVMVPIPDQYERRKNKWRIQFSFFLTQRLPRKSYSVPLPAERRFFSREGSKQNQYKSPILNFIPYFTT